MSSTGGASAASGGNGAGGKASPSGGATSSEAAAGGTTAGAPSSVCQFGADQTCNDSPIVSALWGHCERDGSCTCNEGFVINPASGKCALPSSVTCFSPRQNLERALDSNAEGCTCDPQSDETQCRTTWTGQEVALSCVDGKWRRDDRCTIGTCSITRSVDVRADELGNARVQHFEDSFVLTSFESGATPGYLKINWRGVSYSGQPGRGFESPLSVTALDTSAGAPMLVVVEASQSGSVDVTTSNGNGITFADYYRTPVNRADALTSPDGQLAYVVFGSSSFDANVMFATLNASAKTVGTWPNSLKLPGPSWNCLRVHSDAVMSAFTNDSTGITWSVRLQSGMGEDIPIPNVNTLPSTCPPIAFGPVGRHYAAFLLADGSVQVSESRGPANTTLPAVHTLFDSQLQAELDGFAFVGSDFVFVRRAGEQLVLERFDAQGKLVDAPVSLPDRLTSSAEVIDARGESFYLTYLSEGARVIAEVTCR